MSQVRWRHQTGESRASLESYTILSSISREVLNDERYSASTLRVWDLFVTKRRDGTRGTVWYSELFIPIVSGVSKRWVGIRTTKTTSSRTSLSAMNGIT